MITLSRYLYDFFELFFPELCAACGTNLVQYEDVICTQCIYLLPQTNFHSDPENKLAKQLWGRFPFVQASAFVHFQKGSKVQNIMHQLKYNRRPEAGFKMGKLYAYELICCEKWILPDLIIPVPLHPFKLKKRQYNQSEDIAKGMASVLNLKVSSRNLIRKENTESQTRKTRFSRYTNLISAFAIVQPADLINKHILLVDDVMTTGATLEACSLELLKVPGVSVSVCTLAYAE